LAKKARAEGQGGAGTDEFAARGVVAHLLMV
jgi:hypothetical protein